MAVNPNGTILWHNNHTGPIKGSAAIGWNGYIYVGGTLGFLCIHPMDGSTVWKLEPSPVYSTPAVGYDGSVYIGCNNTFYCIDGNTGKTKWALNSTSPIITSPSIGPDGSVYMILNDTLYAFLNCTTGYYGNDCSCATENPLSEQALCEDGYWTVDEQVQIGSEVTVGQSDLKFTNLTLNDTTSLVFTVSNGTSGSITITGCGFLAGNITLNVTDISHSENITLFQYP
jgi:hypothetical protein